MCYMSICQASSPPPSEGSCKVGSTSRCVVIYARGSVVSSHPLDKTCFFKKKLMRLSNSLKVVKFLVKHRLHDVNIINITFHHDIFYCFGLTSS